MIERRAIVRQKSFMKGRIFFNHRLSSIDCTIRNFTTAGARLQFSESVALPNAFEIYIPSKDEYFQAHAIWHKGCDIGVAWAPEGTWSFPIVSYRSADPIADRLAKLEHEVAAMRKQLETMEA